MYIYIVCLLLVKHTLSLDKEYVVQGTIVRHINDMDSKLKNIIDIDSNYYNVLVFLIMICKCKMKNKIKKF